MAQKKTGGLGKGLGALLPQKRQLEAEQCPIEKLSPSRLQPRTAFDRKALEDLAESLRLHGFLQPIVVRPSGPGYVIIAGERRYQAAKLAGLKTVPIVVREVSDAAAFELGLVENLQREQLNPVDEARSFSHLMEDFGYSHGQIADRIGRSRSAITNAIRLLELPENVQKALQTGAITSGHGRALLALKGRKELLAVFQETLDRQLSVREVEKRVQVLVSEKKPGSRARKPDSLEPYLRQVEQEVRSATGFEVSLRCKGGRPQLLFTFATIAQLEEVVRRVSRET